jgi:hypothetical protein
MKAQILTEMVTDKLQSDWFKSISEQKQSLGPASQYLSLFTIITRKVHATA